MITTDTCDMLTTGQAAARLGRSTKTLQRWADRGLLPSVRQPSGRRLFRLADIDALLATWHSAP